MFSFARKLTRPKNVSPPSPEAGVARVAIAENGAVSYASPAFLALTGMSEQEVGHRHVFSVFKFIEYNQTPLKDIPAGLHTTKLRGQSEPLRFQFDWISASDNQKFLVGAAEEEAPPAAKSQQNSFDTLIKNFDNKQNQSAANQPTQELGPFFNLSGDIMVVLNAAGEIVQTNQQFTKLFGPARRWGFINIFHTEDKPRVQEHIQALSPGYTGTPGRSYAPITDFEARIITQDGDEKITAWRQQQIGPNLYCIGRDLSALKDQKEALKRREQQLMEAESIGRMGHWRWVVGTDTVEWSEEIYRIFGVEAATFDPTLDTMNAMINRSDIGRVNQAFQRAIIEQNDYDMDFRIKRPDGDIRYIRCEGRCERDAEGDVIALYGIMQDMTQRTLYEDQLRAAKDEAERAYAAKSTFLANMSHELRTPLNAIIGFSEMIQQQLLGPIGTEKYLEYIGGIRESGEHLLDLISDILDMSKIEAGKYELDLEELNITKIIQGAVHMIEGRAVDSGIRVTIDPSVLQADLPKIIADRRAVMQIVLNILSNAVKFTNENGKVDIKCHTRRSGIAIEITDNGIGIPPNKLANITRPFEQASSHYAREHEGSGLGLAITKELIELHHGTLKIDSEVGVGTTVTVNLPFDAYKAAQSAAS